MLTRFWTTCEPASITTRGQDLSGVLADIDARLEGWRAYMPRVAANDAVGVAA